MSVIGRAFSFRIADIIGLLLGVILIAIEADMSALLSQLMSYWLYLLVFFGVFVAFFWIWLLSYHGEPVYLGTVVKQFFANYIRITLSMVSLIGVYMLIYMLFLA